MDFTPHAPESKTFADYDGRKIIFPEGVRSLFSEMPGTELPITITGTRDNPVFGVSVLHKTIKKEIKTEQRRRRKKIKNSRAYFKTGYKVVILQWLFHSI